MIALLVTLALGIAVGYVRGGSLSTLRSARLSWMPLVFASLALQAIGQGLPAGLDGVAYALVLCSFAAMFAWAILNRRASGMLFIALGALMNFTVIIANGGMPVSAQAAARLGFVGDDAKKLLQQGKHFIDTGDARLGFLGDWIPVGGRGTIVSIGDLVLWAGLVLLLADLMRGPRGRRTRMDPRDQYAYAPPGHVSSTPGDAMLHQIDVRDAVDTDPRSPPPRAIDLREDRDADGQTH